jgi:hypothetical protein
MNQPSNPISVRSILILSSNLRLDLCSSLFPSGFAIQFCTQISFPTCVLHAPRISSFLIFGVRSSSLRSLVQSPVTCSLLAPNSTKQFFPNTPSLCPSLTARDQVSHSLQNNRYNIGLYILIFTFLDSRREDKRQNLMLSQIIFFKGFGMVN